MTMAQPATQRINIKRLSLWLALGAALWLWLLLSATYLGTAYYHDVQDAQRRAEQAVSVIADYSFLYPSEWNEKSRDWLEGLARGQRHDPLYRYRFVDESGATQHGIGPQLKWPVVTRAARVTTTSGLVLQVEVSKSWRPVLNASSWMGLAAVILSIIVFSLVRWYTQRTMLRGLRRVRLDQGRLRAELRVKDLALKEAQVMTGSMQRMAMHDPITGLPNRAFFVDSLRRSLSNAVMEGKPLAVMMLDLDHFKEINDTLGHDVGDHMLREVGERMSHTLRQNDVMARLGGDEFALLLYGADVRGATAAANKVRLALVPDMKTGSHSLSVEASVGIALFPDHGHQEGMLMQRAEVAMYSAKRGKNHVTVYDPTQDKFSVDRLRLLSDLAHAIGRNELLLFYQPKVDMRTGKVMSAEALLRWNHPELGLVGPTDFIPLAEQSRRIREITVWVVKTALQQMERWHRSGLVLSVAVNLSAQNLHDRDFVLSIQRMVEGSTLDARLLTFEITESAIMAEPALSMKNLVELDKLGVKLSVDDFGTGYSSLAYLKKLPVDELKIDRSFVKDMVTDTDDRMIVSSIIDLAHNLNMQVVAEGIEDHATYQQLKELGCDWAQGFHLSKPVPSEQVLHAVEGITARLVDATVVLDNGLRNSATTH